MVVWSEQSTNGNTLGVMELRALNIPIGSIGANGQALPPLHLNGGNAGLGHVLSLFI